MSTITVDGKPYDLKDLPEAARNQIVNLGFVDRELARLQAQVAAMQTARNAYAKALQGELSSLPGAENGKLK